MCIIHLNHRITAVARFDTDASIPTKQLKTPLQQQSGLDPRRFSRLSLIAALGASLLKQNHRIAPDCAVYTAAPFSSPSVFEKMADNVFNHAAMPFDFIANLHNAAFGCCWNTARNTTQNRAQQCVCGRIGRQRTAKAHGRMAIIGRPYAMNWQGSLKTSACCKRVIGSC